MFEYEKWNLDGCRYIRNGFGYRIMKVEKGVYLNEKESGLCSDCRWVVVLFFMGILKKCCENICLEKLFEVGDEEVIIMLNM